MHETSPTLGMPFLQPAQAQKHVTHNEALERLDAAVQLVLEEVGRDQPPEAADEGSCWGVGAAPMGAFAGHAGDVAVRSNGGWLFLAPAAGWIAELRAAPGPHRFDGTGWAPLGLGALNGLTGVGIGADHAPERPLTVAGAGTLLTHAGTDHRLSVNKAGPSDTASVVFQSGWSGRAEIGLAGDDALSMKVSADGAAFVEAWRAEASGVVRTPGLASVVVDAPGGTVTGIVPPAPSGIAVITGAGAQRPGAGHSGLLAFDVGASPALVPLAAGPDLSPQGTADLDASSGEAGRTMLSARPGALQLLHRTGGARRYAVTFLST